jgi:hypothetical protein
LKGRVAPLTVVVAVEAEIFSSVEMYKGFVV